MQIDDDTVLSEGAPADYARQMASLLGTEVSALSSNDIDKHGFEGPFLLAKVGDAIAAEKLIGKLTKLRDKAGLAAQFMYLTYDPQAGSVVIPLNGFKAESRRLLPGVQVRTVETAFGQHTIDMLKPLQPELQRAINQARDEAIAILKLPSYVPFDESVHDLDEKRVNLRRDGEKRIWYELPHEAGGNLVIRDEIKDGALEAARELRAVLKRAGFEDPSKTRELARTPDIDGDPKTLTDEEIAAHLIAKGFGVIGYHSGHSNVGPSFSHATNNYPANFYQEKGECQDPKVIFEAARQVFGDTYGGKIKGGVDTTTPEGNKVFTDAALKSPLTQVFL